MDKQKAKILIKKINSLFGSFEMEEGQLSAIERDLMLKYIRDLYEEFVENGNHQSQVIIPSSGEQKKNKKIKKKEKAILSAKALTIEPILKTQEPAPAPSPTTTLAPPVIPTPVAPPIEKIVAPPPATTTTLAPVYEAAPATFNTSGANSRIEQLFSFKQAKELSEKLGEQPIKDLSTALSINDKLLYTNELFGRNHNILGDSLNTLNKFDNMDQARGFLMSVAEQYEWADDERSDIARNFIKTIRRRYVS